MGLMRRAPTSPKSSAAALCFLRLRRRLVTERNDSCPPPSGSVSRRGRLADEIRDVVVQQLERLLVRIDHVAGLVEGELDVLAQRRLQPQVLHLVPVSYTHL